MESHEKDLRSVVESEQQVRDIQNDFRTAGLPPREVALLEFAVKLTRKPWAMNRPDLANLRIHGFPDDQLVDLVHCIGYFNFINRVLDGLGVDPEPSMRYGKFQAETPV
jgi:uncharacterized peroxidase-related enzyme